MQTPKTQLKIASWLVLFFAATVVIKMVVGIVSNVPDLDGLFAKLMSYGTTVLLLLPQIYVGVRGLAMAQNPTKGKAHIVWATIYFVILALGTLGCVVELIDGEGSPVELLSMLVEAAVYFGYICYAKKVAKEAA